MRWLRHFRRVLCLILPLAADTARAQSGERITAWRASDGLPQSAAAAITLTPRGHAIVTFAPSLPLVRLDGYQVATLTNTSGVANRVFESRSAQFWCATTDGLLENTGEGWNPHPIEEIAAEYRAHPLRAARPVPILPLDRNRALILLPDRLLEFDAGEHHTTLLLRASSTRLDRFCDLGAARDDGIWVSAQRGLLHLKGPLRQIRPDSASEEFLIPDSFGLLDLQRPHESVNGAIVMSANDSTSRAPFVLRCTGGRWERWAIQGQNLRQAWSGPDGVLWGTTPATLLRFESDGPSLRPHVFFQASRIVDVAVEPGGASWLATSEGIHRIAPLPWRPAIGFPSAGAVVAVAVDHQGRVLAATDHSIHRQEGTGWQSLGLPGNGTDDAALPSEDLFPLGNGGLLAGHARGATMFDQEGRVVALDPAIRDASSLGTLPDGRILMRGNGDQASEILAFDGSTSRPFASLPDTVAELGELAIAFQTRSGELWLGGESGAAVRRDGRWVTADPGPQARSDSGETPGSDGALAALELPDGRLLLGGRDTVREFDGRRWTVLRRGLERVHGLQLARDGSIWVASDNGLHRYKERSWITLGEDEGLPAAAIFAVLQDGAGRIWAGTARGLYAFDIGADVDAPQAFIVSADVPERAGDTRALFVVGGEDRWKFAPAGRLLFSWSLDNAPWSVWRNASSVQFTNVAAGEHRFEVRSMDPCGNVQTRPATHEFSVVLAWFRDPRLVASSVGLAVLAVLLGLQAFLSYRRLKRSYAEVERQVAERSAALEKANTELLHSQKMRALGTLAAGVAHDFNNLLSIIRGSAQLAEGQLDDREKTRQRLQRIKTAVDQGAGLVKAMLGYSRGTAAPRRNIEVTEIVLRAVRLFDEGHAGSIGFIPPTSPLPHVVTSPEMLQQIVLNLLQNAAEATETAAASKPEPAEPPVEVTVRETSVLPPDLILKPAPAPRYVEVAIRDHGIGIPPENLARIFEPFFTTKGFSSRRGTGLGLSMAYEFAKELDAGLAVESRLGHGSTFRIVLPAP